MGDSGQRRLLLVYDGDCGFCQALSAWLVKKGAIVEAQRVAFQAFGGETEAALRAAGIRNEIAVLDPASLEIRTGVRGLSWIAADGRFARWARLASRPPFHLLADHGYRLLATNRRILSPVSPERRALCRCDPDPHLGYQGAFVALGLLVGALAFAAWGAWFAGTVGAAARGWPLGLLVSVLSFGLPALVLFVRGRREEAGHLAFLAFLAGVVLLVALFCAFVSTQVAPSARGWLTALAFLSGLVPVAWLALLRARRLGWPIARVVAGLAWFVVCLGLSAWLLVRAGTS